MAPPQKGKQGTRGAKQIVEENLSTLAFYRAMAVAANVIALVVLYFYYSYTSVFLNLFSWGVYIASYQFMAYMARVKYTETGQLCDSGVDLNMQGGIAEHVKDIIILTAGCQVLSSIISNYFWFLWLLAPIRAFWIIWKNILSPYFFQQASNQPEADEKKQKKIARKMRRQHE